MQVGRPLNKPAVAIDNDLRRLIGVREFSGDRFQNVQRGHQSLHHAKFIGHDDETAAGAAQDAEQIDRIQRFRYHNRRGGGGQRRDVFARLQSHQHLLRPHDTNDFIQFSAADREQTVRRRKQLTANFIYTLLGVDPADFPARRHDAAQRALSQGQHAVNHVALFFRKGAFRYRHRRRAVSVVVDGGLFITAAHQTQDRIRGTGAQRQRRLVTYKVAARHLVKELNDDRETDRRVKVPFRNMEAKPFRHQTQADHQQEAQTEHHHRRVLVDKARQRLGGQQHHDHRDHDRCHHHRQMVHHPDRGDHRVQ